MEEEKEETIITTSSVSSTKKKLMDLPLICLVEISGFIDNDKNCLSLRNISKKFNEAIQIKLFMKTKAEDAEFYKKCFLILNPKCHKYFTDNIYPYLINADGVYQFFNWNNEETFNKLFKYCFNELKQIIFCNNLKLKEKNLEKTFRKSVIRFLVTMIIINFEEEKYDFLDFKELEPYEDAKEMIILLVRLMKKINYLDLSYLIINDDSFLGKLIDKINNKNEFTLLLEGVYLNNDLIKKIKLIKDKNLDIKIIIDKKYNGQINYCGGKKMNKAKNLNKKKFKNIEFIK